MARSDRGIGSQRRAQLLPDNAIRSDSISGTLNGMARLGASLQRVSPSRAAPMAVLASPLRPSAAIVVSKLAEMWVSKASFACRYI